MQQLPREQQIARSWESLRQVRSRREFEDIQLARYGRPQLSPGFEKTPLDKPSIHFLWDDTAIKANEMFARGLWSITHNSAIDWFGYELPKELKGDQEGDQWCAEIVTEDIKSEFKDGGLYEALLHRLYDVGMFGYGAIYSYEDPERPGHLAYEYVPAAECFFTLNGKGLCNRFQRPLNLTAAEMIDDYQFPRDRLDQAVITAYDNKNHATTFLVLHVVERRKAFSRKPRSNQEFEFSGEYYFPATQKVLSSHGFMDMPYHVQTWGGSRGNPYPYSIGYTTLPEIRNINGTRKKFDRVLEMESDSPILGPDMGEQPGGEQFRPNPGDFIPSGMSGDGKRLYDPLFSGGGTRTTVNEVTTSRQLIQDAFHNQLFMMQTQRQMTAEEVRSRDAKIIQAMGPFLVFMTKDLASIVDRTFGYRLMQGAYDPLPAILDATTDLLLKFGGILAKAQESLQGEQIVALMMEAQVIMQLDPEAVLAGTDFNAAYRALASSKSLPPGIVYAKEKYEKTRASRAEQQQQQQMMAAAPGLAAAAKDGAQAMESMNSATQPSGALAP